MTLAQKVFFFAGVFLLSAGLGANQISLFLEPDATRERIGVVEEGDERLLHGSALFQQDLARERWAWAEFEDEFRGFIREEDIGKDQMPLDGVEVFTRPTEASSVLTRFGTDDELRVVNEGVWWEVLITKSIPVYYQLPRTDTPQAPAARPPVQVVESAPPAPPRPQESFVEDEGRSIAAARSQVRASEPDSRSGETTRAPAPARQDRSIGTSGDLPRTFTGTLRQASRNNPFRSPVRPLELVDADGRRIAWVDTSRMVSPHAVSQMVGRSITIFGEFEAANNRPEIILFAKSIHPR